MAENTGAPNNLPRRPEVAAIRRSKGISLGQISETTKISKRFLEAIEEGDFGKLPGGIFNTSYIKQYAREIDIDDEELLAYYYSRTGTSPPRKEPSVEGSRKTGGKGVRLPILARF